MATLILSTAGQVLFGPVGGAVGSIAGQYIDQTILFAPKARHGPRLGDLSVQTSSYGSALPKLFGAMRVAGTVIWATDLVDYFFTAYGAYARSVLGVRRERYLMETQDAQALTYGDEVFDRVFSVSVVEHIPGDGDVAAMHEIARVLKPGGVVCLTVP